MKLTSKASIKRALKLNSKWSLEFLISGNILKRKVEHVQSNAVRFEGDSWLLFNKLGYIKGNGDNSFTVGWSENELIIVYRFIE